MPCLRERARPLAKSRAESASAGQFLGMAAKASHFDGGAANPIPFAGSAGNWIALPQGCALARRRSRAPASGAETRGPGLVQPVFVGGGVRGRADEDGDALSASVPHEFGITGAVAAPPYVTGCAAGFWRPAGARQKGSWPGGLACAQGLCRQRTAVA